MTESRQLPKQGEVFLDHLAHFVADMAAASRDLDRLGFVQTPYTVHQHHIDGETGPVPAGTANRCLLLREGYIEIVAVTDPATPLGQRNQSQIDRYVGLHVLAFGTSDAEAVQGRLTLHGFHPTPLVHLRRPVELPNGADTVAEFTVCRVREVDMPEARTQFVAHHSEDAVWQKRWMDHGNRISALRDVVIVVENLDTVAARYCWFLDKGSPKRAKGGGWSVPLDRGGLVICDPEGLETLLPGLDPPSLPFVAGYGVLSDDVATTHEFLQERGFPVRDLGDDVLRLDLPASLGGTMLIASDAGAFPWATPPAKPR